MLNFRANQKFLDLSLMLSVFLTPLIFFTSSRDQFELPKLTFLAILLIPFILQRFRNNPALSWTPLSYALLFFFMTQAAASFPKTSLSWSASILGDYENFSGLTTLLIYGFWFWSLDRFLYEARIEKTYFFVSIAAVLSSFYAMGQHFGLDFIPWNPESVNATREFASMGNPNFLSAYLAMSIPLYLSLVLKSQFITEPEKISFEDKSWALAAGGLLVLGFGLFCAASRGGFLGAIGGFFLWFFLIAGQRDLRLKFQKSLTVLPSHFRIVLGSAFLVSVISLGFFGHSFLDRLWNSITHIGESLAVSRLHIWRPAVEIIKSNLLFGTGLDTFKIAFPFYSGIEFNLIDGMFMSSRMAHNELLQITSTTGILGLISYLGLLAAFSWTWWKSFKVSNASGRWILAGLLASSSAYHIQNLFSFGVAALNFVWFMHLSVVQAFYRKRPSSPSPSAVPSPPINILKKLLMVIILLSLFFFYLPRLGADIAFSRGSAVSQLLKKPDPEMPSSGLLFYSDYQISQLNRAVSLCPLEVKYHLYLGLAFEQRASLDKEKYKECLLEALRCYQKSAEISPANAYYYNDEGRIFNALSVAEPGYLNQAEEAFEKAVHWAPASPYFVVNWALSLEKNGKVKESGEAMKKAFALSPSFTSKVLAQMAFESYQKGDKKTAFRRIEDAVRGNTSSAEAYYCRGILYLSEKDKKKALTDFEAVKNLHPTPEKNPSIQNLDAFMAQAKN